MKSAPASGNPQAIVMGISVVIPLRNDEASCGRLLNELEPFRSADLEVVVVEAEDSTTTRELRCHADLWLRAPAGRAAQLAVGARAARHRCLWFVHADTCNVTPALCWLQNWCGQTKAAEGWGRFEIVFDDNRVLHKMVSWFMNWRSRLTSIATGDQGIFVTAGLLAAAGGWPQQLLMEDVELSSRLRRRTPPSLPLPGAVTLTTSARRWRANGVWRTILLMWGLRLRYAFGADPALLHERYYVDNRVRRDTP